jgi:hypothetical protein
MNGIDNEFIDNTYTAPKTSKYEFLSNDEFFIETTMGDLEEVRSNERYR